MALEGEAPVNEVAQLTYTATWLTLWVDLGNVMN